jgi:small-conductance mechanosensitive channel
MLITSLAGAVPTTSGTAASANAPHEWQELLNLVRGYGWFDLGWSLGILVAAYLAGRVGGWLLLRSFKRWTKRTATLADDALAEHLPEPLRLGLPALAVHSVLPLVSLPVALIDVLEQAALVVVITATGWLAYRSVRVVEDVVEHRYDLSATDNLRARSVYTQLHAFRNIAGFVIVVVTSAFALMTFSTVRHIGAGLLASAGVAGIVLGFAAQRSLSTLLGGIQIALTQPIRVDDVVIVENEWGRIEEITLTYVVVRIWDERRLIVPVSQFLEKAFQNWTRVSAELLGTVELHLDYSVPIDAIRSEFQRVLTDSPLWDKRVCSVQVTDASETTMLVRLLLSARNSSDAWDLRCEAREKLIGFVQRNYPQGLPRLRAELTQPPGAWPAGASRLQAAK